MSKSYQTEGFVPDEELSEFLTKIWELDDNKCFPGEHFQIDLQDFNVHNVEWLTHSNKTDDEGRSCHDFSCVYDLTQIVNEPTHVPNTDGYVGYQGGDWASDKLFEWLDEDAIFSKRTYKAFRALLDNYEMEAGEAETYTFEEKQETVEFIDAIMETEVMKETHKFLVSKGKAPESVGEFKWKLLNLWFKLVRRTKGDRDLDSSSFEHVFVGETRKEGMIGLHNWIQYYLQEKAGNIDYQGYRKRATNLDDKVDRLICTKFLWRNRQEKPSCSMFLGTSPEFDIAAFTTCFLMERMGHCDYQLGEYEIELVVFPFASVIGTAYIVPARMDE